MAYDWIGHFFVPIIEVVFIVGIFAFISYVFIRAFVKMWEQQWRFIWKYSIRKKQYPEKTVEWCLSAIDNGITYYEIKKRLLIKGISGYQFDETLWIYDKLLINLKGGKDHGRKYERISGEIEKTKGDLSTIKTNS